MADDPGSPLLRLTAPRLLTRKRRIFKFPGPPPRDPPRHAARLGGGLAEVRKHVEDGVANLQSFATDVPYVRLEFARGAVVMDGDLASLGLVPVYRREDSVLAAYAKDGDLRTFEKQLTSYGQLQKKLAVLAKIESVKPWSREDRMGPQLAELTIDSASEYTVDVLVMPVEGEEQNPQALRAIETFVSEQRGRIVDRALEPTFSALRVRLGGQALDQLLEYRDDIAIVELPPAAGGAEVERYTRVVSAIAPDLLHSRVYDTEQRAVDRSSTASQATPLLPSAVPSGLRLRRHLVEVHAATPPVRLRRSVAVRADALSTSALALLSAMAHLSPRPPASAGRGRHLRSRPRCCILGAPQSPRRGRAPRAAGVRGRSPSDPPARMTPTGSRSGGAWVTASALAVCDDARALGPFARVLAVADGGITDPHLLLVAGSGRLGAKSLDLGGGNGRGRRHLVILPGSALAPDTTQSSRAGPQRKPCSTWRLSIFGGRASARPDVHSARLEPAPRLGRADLAVDHLEFAPASEETHVVGIDAGKARELAHGHAPFAVDSDARLGGEEHDVDRLGRIHIDVLRAADRARPPDANGLMVTVNNNAVYERYDTTVLVPMDLLREMLAAYDARTSDQRGEGT